MKEVIKLNTRELVMPYNKCLLTSLAPSVQRIIGLRSFHPATGSHSGRTVAKFTTLNLYSMRTEKTSVRYFSAHRLPKLALICYMLRYYPDA